MLELRIVREHLNLVIDFGHQVLHSSILLKWFVH
jgi:hypothetical protein